MCIMGESEGREDEIGDTDSSAVPESVRAVHEQGDAPDPSFSDRLSSFSSRRESTGALDLAAALDEPEQLIRYLIIACQEHVGYSQNSAKWMVILGHLARATMELEKLNEPASHRGAKASPS
jgi:hypothetical protein